MDALIDTGSGRTQECLFSLCQPPPHTLPATSTSSNTSPTHKSPHPSNQPPQMRNRPRGLLQARLFLHVPTSTPPCVHDYTSHGTLRRSQPSQGAGHRDRRAWEACSARIRAGAPTGLGSLLSPIAHHYKGIKHRSKAPKDLRICGNSQKPKRKKKSQAGYFIFS